MFNLDIVTVIIIISNVIVSFKGFKDYIFRSNYLFNIAGIQRGEQYRFFTSGFLHSNQNHLFFNMLTLFFFAGTVVYKLGDVKFLIIYFASLLGGNFLSYLIHREEYHYSALGASGAVSGIIYSAILLDPTMRIYFGIPGWLFGIGYLIYSFYGMKKLNDNIGHDAHFGGAVAGVLLTLVYDYSLIFTNTITVIAMFLTIVVLFILMKVMKN
ncbi:membrane associated rhomboid family serine protease [Nonlabens dokdonensis]|jgi:membrane associated rhomboid family serine protease|uniref:Membrane associated rhomboid family serine protease n=2 Tax=Nonlabens dokdonensis TaxID=328515 RepID=A0ABX5PUS6_9FLAO|nr:rhomboid family intramembrane serine protease [Nonlabens dokdonensis]AGC78136.1 putative transmembrane rhomboid family protein [Nonlabens dokdonensis DSW-6]PZX37196.1 membrane associated rhomboid family serine protease [Nonlabens dokdonensis]